MIIYCRLFLVLHKISSKSEFKKGINFYDKWYNGLLLIDLINAILWQAGREPCFILCLQIAQTIATGRKRQLSQS